MGCPALVTSRLRKRRPLDLSTRSDGMQGRVLPARVSVILVIAAGWFSQRLLTRGVPSRVARGIFGGACVVLGGAAMAIMPDVPSISAKIGLTTIGVALPSVIYVMGNAVVSEIAPVSQRGAMLAIGTAVSTSAGLLAPLCHGQRRRDRGHRSPASTPALRSTVSSC